MRTHNICFHGEKENVSLVLSLYLKFCKSAHLFHRIIA